MTISCRHALLACCLWAPLAGCSLLFETAATDAGAAEDAASDDAGPEIAYESVWQVPTGRATGYVRVGPDDRAVFAGSLFGPAEVEGNAFTPVGASDMLLVKLDERGLLDAARQFGSTGQEFVSSLEISSEGRVLVTGGARGAVTFDGVGELQATAGSGVFVGFAALYSGDDFEPAWGLLYQNGDSNSLVGSSDVADNAVFVCGTAKTSVTLPSTGGAEVAIDVANDNAIAFHAHYQIDGSFVAANYGGIPATQGAQCEVARSDDRDEQYLMGAFSGEMALGGSSYAAVAGERSIFIAHVLHANNVEWATVLEGNTLDAPRLRAATFANGDALIAVQFAGGLRSPELDMDVVSGGSSDIALYRVALATGEILFAKSFPSTGFDRPYEVAVGPSGEIALVGTFSDTINFGGDDLISTQGNDAFIAIFDEDGNHVWSTSYGAGDDDSALGVDFDSSGALYVSFRHQGIDVGLGPLPGENQGAIVRYEKQ